MTQTHIAHKDSITHPVDPLWLGNSKYSVGEVIPTQKCRAQKIKGLQLQDWQTMWLLDQADPGSIPITIIPADGEDLYGKLHNFSKDKHVEWADDYSEKFSLQYISPFSKQSLKHHSYEANLAGCKVRIFSERGDILFIRLSFAH